MTRTSAKPKAGRPSRASPLKAPILATKVTKSPATGATRGRKPGSTFSTVKIGKDGCKLKKRRKSVALQMRLQREKSKAKRAEAVDDKGEGNKLPGPTKEFNDELKNSGLEWEAEKIVDSKLKKGKRFYMVKWVGYPDSQNSWEPEVNLRNSTDLITEFDETFPDKP